MLALASGDTIIELGCGDGRVMRRLAAAGYNVIGYELNPILVAVAHIYTWRYRQKVTIIWGDYWRKEWPPAKGMYVFLLEKYMKKLDKKLGKYSKTNGPISVVSYAFQIPKKRAKTSKSGLYLYKY
jgi:16S rRNA A1518/A1519 N6-dimethyltransferase RsmA/KsgA/DIM1 with predicted DNA glycosylase/AP lyase activity